VSDSFVLTSEERAPARSQARVREERRELLLRVARRIDTLREARGLTPEDLQSAARLSYWQVRGALELGAAPDFHLSAVGRIAKALGVPVTELLS
jgi:ribosome-binding protein aMBF1 (putative translation factor)